MAAFIYQWTRREYEAHRQSGNNVLDHAASNVFRQRGMEAEDQLFVVACFDDKLFLLGRLDVDVVLGPAGAAQRFRQPVERFEDFSDHAVCAKGNEGYLYLDLVVPNTVVAKLEFENGSLPAMRDTPDGPVRDVQTFRTVRELSDDAMATHDDLLLAHEAKMP